MRGENFWVCVWAFVDTSDGLTVFMLRQLRTTWGISTEAAWLGFRLVGAFRDIRSLGMSLSEWKMGRKLSDQSNVSSARLIVRPAFAL